MSFTNEKFSDKFYQIYTEKGFYAACLWAEKQRRVKWEHCDGCESDVPVITGQHICLICGQQTHKL